MVGCCITNELNYKMNQKKIFFKVQANVTKFIYNRQRINGYQFNYKDTDFAQIIL